MGLFFVYCRGRLTSAQSSTSVPQPASPTQSVTSMRVDEPTQSQGAPPSQPDPPFQQSQPEPLPHHGGGTGIFSFGKFRGKPFDEAPEYYRTFAYNLPESEVKLQGMRDYRTWLQTIGFRPVQPPTSRTPYRTDTTFSQVSPPRTPLPKFPAGSQTFVPNPKQTDSRVSIGSASRTHSTTDRSMPSKTFIPSMGGTQRPSMSNTYASSVSQQVPTYPPPAQQSQPQPKILAELPIFKQVRFNKK